MKRLTEASCGDSYSSKRVYKPINGAPFFRVALPVAPKYDIATVGDSFVFGACLRAEDTFPSQMKLLTGKKVLNLGIPCAGPVEYGKLVEIGLKYGPDIILYCVFANDFHDSLNLRGWAGKHLNNPDCPDISINWEQQFFVDEKTIGPLALAIKKVKSEIKTAFLLRAMVGFCYLYYTDFIKKYVVPINIEGKREYCVPQFWNQSLTLRRNSWAKQGFAVMVNDIKAAYKITQKRQKKFLVVLIPCKEMVYEALTETLDMETARNTYRELEKTICDENIPCFNATDFLVTKERQDSDHLLFFTADPHLNKYGNVALAEGIVQYMRENLFL